ncbi:DUF1343 domain-containing protein [Flavobacteriaceae bacterium F89]|uniref:DUF1343 domain-containing protein n=1 Tax=Cerina litoralis TaxID=2874477 RepID=A0AAE3JRX3_9FLAO|nr:DUF1343 domain-containing protein [Cerina litoralis]MCG2461833.1 DUF1343 domain-containing protein [Cerina litoralis]
MAFLSCFKNTVLLSVFTLSICGNPNNGDIRETDIISKTTKTVPVPHIVVGANQTKQYLPFLKGKKVGVVANQTSVIFKDPRIKSQEPGGKDGDTVLYTHLVDSLLSLHIDIKTVFAPEHGFRGEADAGEHVKDGKDAETGLPLISLYGKNRKPSAEQLKYLDVVVFDIQDVGTRFYTYIATLQLVMEACAENHIPILVLDRPNPNGSYVDGPTMEKEHTGFLGMTTIPLVYGMTIGEYAQMINSEGWLEKEAKADLEVIPMVNYTHKSTIHLPIRPSPNLPNDKSINLYPSLGLFEGTNVNAGRGTEFQFQRYGASFLDSTKYDYSYIPEPNFGSKHPKQEGKKCFGEDLSQIPNLKKISLKWLINAYNNTTDKSLFFNTSGFTKHAGTAKLQQQIEAGMTEEAIKKTWQPDLESFKKIREKYLIYR